MTGMASQVPHVFQWPNGTRNAQENRFIDGFSIVVGGDTPSLLRQTLR